MIIRPMSESDLKEVLAIEAVSYAQPWSESLFTEELSALSRTYLVAVDRDEVAGYGGIMTVTGEAHITTITVAPARRRSGVGTDLMLALIDAGLEAGSEHLALEVRPSNESARRLYERFGMAPVGIARGYYRDEDALIMWAHDINRAEYRDRLNHMRVESA